MTLGTFLIWASWLYVLVAILMAKAMYRRAQKANPTYFEASDGAYSDPFKLKETRGTFELITDDSLELSGFDRAMVKMIRRVKIMYFTAPIAFVIFVFGICIR